MKADVPFRIVLARLLISFLCLTATWVRVSAQQTTESEKTPIVSVGVLVDTSAHQKKVIEFEREALNSLADAFAGFGTEGFVIRYGNEVETLQDWSPPDAGLKKASTRIALDTESERNPGTLLYEGLNAALQKLATREGITTKVLIVIGEGNNAGGSIKYAQIKKQAQAGRVQCFVLLVADHNLMGGRVRHFGFELYDLASATKGKAYDIERSRKNLDKAIRDVLKRSRPTAVPA